MKLTKNGTIKLTTKEFGCIYSMFQNLRRYPQWEPLKEKVANILEKKKDNREFTNDELEKYFEWRMPKGTIWATPCYVTFLQRYWNLRKCKACNGLGYNATTRMGCNECHGSGCDPNFRKRVLEASQK